MYIVLCVCAKGTKVTSKEVLLFFDTVHAHFQPSLLTTSVQDNCNLDFQLR